MKEIFIYCHTNLDVRESWPSHLPARPMKGDLIESISGLQLEVKRVTFTYYYEGGLNDWSLNVELGLVASRFESLADFEKWYKEWRRT